MSKVNIKRTVENIRANTTAYSPIVEVVVNALQAIESTGRQDGQITVRVFRVDQMEMDGGLSDIRSFEVEDNGAGFNAANRESFDTLYSDFKISEGGKGFGRFICLKYFDDVQIDSVFSEDGKTKRRTFSMGKESDIIIDERVADAPKATQRTIVHLKNVKERKFTDKKLNTIARNLVEKLLPNFLTKGYVCPLILLTESDGGESICLNDWLSNELSGIIREIEAPNGDFSLKAFDVDEPFAVRVFKLYSPKIRKAKSASLHTGGKSQAHRSTIMSLNSLTIFTTRMFLGIGLREELHR